MADQARAVSDVQALFDAKAAGWPGKYAPGGPLAGRLAGLARTLRGHVDNGGAVLDLGCGSGELARHLAAIGYRVTGCDIAPRMLVQASSADYGQSVQWIRLDSRWRALPFPAGALDAVVASSVLEYMPDPAAVLRECARVLRPGGIVLCTVPDVTHPVRWLECPLAALARTPLAHIAAGAWPRLGQYAEYLRVSRQRRTASWWVAAGRQAGLRPALARRPAAPRAALRTLAFIRPGERPGTARSPGAGNHGRN